MAEKHKIPKTIKELERTVSERPVSWRAVAESIGVTRATVRKWRIGRSMPKEENIKKLKEAIRKIIVDFPVGTPEERHAKSMQRLGWDDNKWYLKRGRKTLFRDAMIKEAEKLASYGLIMEEIALFWHLNVASLQRWAKRYPEFGIAIKEGKLKADNEVVKSLYKRATGFTHTERHYEIEYQEDNTAVRMLRKEIVKETAPDVTAQIYWTKNRRPDKWRDDRNLGLFGGDGPPVSIRFVEEKPNRSKDEAPPPINNSVEKEETGE